MNQEFEQRKETKQSQVLVVIWIGASGGLDRVWIGSGSVWIRVWIGPEVDPIYVAAWMEYDKKRTARCAGSKRTAWLLGRLALQLTTVSAWQFDSLDAQPLQLGCWTA